MPDAMRVLGSVDATPLEFWIGVPERETLQLDDIVCVETATGDGRVVRFYGVVDVVRKRYEGASFDSDAFRAAAGLYFTCLYVGRGFGVAVGAHAGYDVLVGVTV